MGKTKQMRFEMVLAAVDKATQVVDRVSSKAIRNLDKIQKRSDQLARQGFNFARQSAAIGIAAGGLLASTVLPAAGLETRMANVSTLIDTNVESMAKMKAEVLDIATRAPVKIDDLAASLYDVRSAGIASNDAMKVLNASARLSVAGLGTAEEATNILTSAYNAFRSEGLEVAQINDILFKTVKAGKTTVAALSQAFGASAPIIQSAGVKLVDFSAATAALTSVGTPAAQAQNQVRAAVVALLKPTAEMDKIFKALGVKSGPELIKKSGSIGKVFDNVARAAKSQGLELSKVWSRTEALAASTSIAGATNMAYLETLNDMVNGSNRIDEAFEKQSQTFNSQKQLFINNIQTMAISLGSVLLPALIDVMKHLKPIIEGIRSWVVENPKMTKVIIGATAAIATITLGLSAFGFIFGGVMQAISIGAQIFKAVTVVIRTVTLVTKALNFALLLNPWVLIAAAAIAAVVLIYKYWDNVKAFFVGLWNWLKSNWDVVLAAFMPFIGLPILIVRNWDKISGFFAGLWDSIIQKAGKLYNGLKKIFQKVRDLLPFSPAKDGPFRELHKVRIVETIADAQKPAPLVRKMKLVTASAMIAAAPVGGLQGAGGIPAPFGSVGQNFGGSGSGSSGMVINYNPTVNVNGGGSPEAVRLNVLAALREHEGELLEMIERAQGRKTRKSFG